MAAAVKQTRIGGASTIPSPATESKNLLTPGRKDNVTSPADRKLSISKTDEQKIPTAEQLKRRRSTFKNITANLMSIRRMTKSSLDKDMIAAAAAAAKPKVRMENTYRTTPSDGQNFNACRAKELIQKVLQEELKGQTYIPARAARLVAVLSERVKAAMKSLQCERHKLVSNVVIGPVSEQGMVVASRCLWDTSTDNSSTVTFNNGSIFAIANVFAVYYE